MLNFHIPDYISSEWTLSITLRSVDGSNLFYHQVNTSLTELFSRAGDENGVDISIIRAERIGNFQFLILYSSCTGPYMHAYI